jgi:hypothetical protein
MHMIHNAFFITVDGGHSGAPSQDEHRRAQEGTVKDKADADGSAARSQKLACLDRAAASQWQQSSSFSIRQPNKRELREEHLTAELAQNDRSEQHEEIVVTRKRKIC